MRRLVELPGTAEDILAADERLLAEAVASVRVQPFSQRAITIGVRPTATMGLQERATARGLPVVRRGSGGEGLLHEIGDLAWSVVLPRSDPRARGYIQRYAAYGQGVVDLLRELGQDSAWTPANAHWPAYCLTSGRGQVLSVSGRALGGASQHVSAQALLHHGTLSLVTDAAALAELFTLPPAVIEADLTSLRGLGLEPPSDLATRLAESLARALEDPGESDTT